MSEYSRIPLKKSQYL